MNLPTELAQYVVEPSNKRWIIYKVRGKRRVLVSWRPTEKAARMWARELEARNAELYHHG